MARLPTECQIFRDRADGELYEAVDFREDCCGEVIGFVMRFLDRPGAPVYYPPNNWIGLEWAVPVTAAAREMLAAANAANER